MSEFDPGPYIRDEHGHQPSVEDQIHLAHFLREHDVTPTGNELKQKEIAELLDEHDVELDHSLKTVLDNLEDIDIIESFYPHDGNKWFPISERLDEIVFENFEEVVKTDQRRFIRYMQAQDPGEDAESGAVADGGPTVRTVVANKADVMPENVEEHLRKGDINEQRRKLKEAIDIVEWHEAVENGDDYGRVVWRHMAYRYQLTAWAIETFTEEE